MTNPETETMTKVLVAEELDAKLDAVLPYEPYEPSRLDYALVEEAFVNVMSRWSVLWDTFEDEGVASKFHQFDVADRVYADFPEDSWRADDGFMENVEKNDGRYNVKISRFVLNRYGSNQAHIPENQLSGFVWEPTMQFCREHFTQQQANLYFQSVNIFQDTLIKMGVIAEDEMLRDPMQLLGNEIYNLLLLDDEKLADAKQAWAEFLDQEIGAFDFVGENPDVMDDTIQGLLNWVNKRVTEYATSRTFSDQSKWHYGPNGEHWFDKHENMDRESDFEPEVIQEIPGQQSFLI